MNRYDFMRQLESLLSDITPGERQEALQFYNDYFDDAGAENEQDVIKALGSPAKVAGSIKAGLSGNAAAGEFTETGYKDPYSKNQELMKYGQSGQNGNGQNDNTQNRSKTAQNGTYQGNSYNSASYNNTGYNNTGYHNTGYHTNSGQNGAPGKKGMSGTTLALVIILCIIGIPIVLPVGIGLVGVVIAIVAVIASLLIAVVAVAFALIIVGVVLFVLGITKLIVSPFGGLYLVGGGLACIGMGILFAMLIIWLCTVVVPAVIKAIIALCSKLFSGRKASKA